MSDLEKSVEFRQLSNEIRELRVSIDELNGLLRVVFRIATESPTPKATKPQKKRTKSKQAPERKRGQAESFDEPGRHF